MAKKKEKLGIVSRGLFRASDLERRTYHSDVGCRFLVGVEGTDPNTWARITAYGSTHAERKAYALKVYFEMYPERARRLQG
jgi:hypothetical protein